MFRLVKAWTIPAGWCLLGIGSALADCPSFDDPIATDRPTFANSSAVVPTGSLQSENGFGFSRGQGVSTWDLPESRLRLGVARCTEILVDFPDYTHAEVAGGVAGWTSYAPTIKHQFQDLPEGLTLSGAVGTTLNTGDKAIAGPGPSPYVQMPWSFDLGEGWSANGMYGATFHPRAQVSDPDNQTSVFLDRIVNDFADVFVEYANDYQHGAPALNRFDVGGSYRYLPTRQIDVKVGVGANHASPDWYFTVGYSMRFDRLF